ncbi:MAG: hypothetical protein HQL99_09035 [Magnetococcales bacterium]|nr:hypothetical protein [Magnetococcales bacterium]
MAQPSDPTPYNPQPEGADPDAQATPPAAPGDPRRRRLLKGLIGVGVSVPVILTLQRDALAKFGSQQACMDEMPDGTTLGDPCQSAADDWIRASRSTFNDYTNQTGILTGGSGGVGDQCLVYFDPDNGWYDHTAAGSATTSYGKTAGYRAVTNSCWFSFHNSGNTSGITGHP